MSSTIEQPSPPPERQIRAVYGERTIRVYQAYSPAIAEPAIAAQRFVTPFRRGRMTWIKPSFLWMMYRAGWATKEGQERILAIDVLRSGFEWALAHASLSHFDRTIHASPEAWKHEMESAPVRIQWDPERTIQLAALPWRTIQIGLSGAAVDRYVDEWTCRIEDVTAVAHLIRTALAHGDVEHATSLLPHERPYPIDPTTMAVI
jgi:hypothetical protein